MAERVKVLRVVHTIHATYDIARCRALYLDALGGLIFYEGYLASEDRDATLLYVGDHMIEPIAPRTPADHSKPFARMMARTGESFHSFEIAVASAPEAWEQLVEADCQVTPEAGGYFFVRRESTGGILLEVCDVAMPNDPADRPGWTGCIGRGHASGVIGLNHLAAVVPDAETALTFFTTVLDGRLIEDDSIAAPQPARRCLVGLGDTDISLIEPDGSGGVLDAFLGRSQNGIYALVWQVADLERARNHFRALGLDTTTEDCVSGGFAIAPEHFLGARHEFMPAARPA